MDEKWRDLTLAGGDSWKTLQGCRAETLDEYLRDDAKTETQSPPTRLRLTV